MKGIEGNENPYYGSPKTEKNYLGWIPPWDCVSFMSWASWDVKEAGGTFHRRFGFEWKEGKIIYD